jgi:predicted P-loop ATPase
VVPAAKRNPWHPIRAYLDGLTWDGTNRLDDLLAVYFGAEASPYASAVGRCMLIAAVARVRVPGCKVDSMPILEGAQGTFKSTALRVLAGESWFTDAEIDPTSKDASMAIRGRWLVEMGELHAMRRSEVNQLKAWITRQTDRQRDPYDRRMSDNPRQSIFVGTTNQEEYLRDETGNRRFWPVRVGTLDLARIKADRDQLWAEAAKRHADGEPWWLSGELEQQAGAQQAERFQADVWEEAVAAWLDTGRDFEGLPIDATTSMEVCVSALNLDKSRLTGNDANRVSSIMRRLGWRRQAVWIGGKAVKGFKRPEREAGPEKPNRLGTPT